jgi:hypothetical protein
MNKFEIFKIWFTAYNAAHEQCEGFKVKQTDPVMLDQFEQYLKTTKKPETINDLQVGDCFRWKNPPTGWTSKKLMMMDHPPGYAMPEGWDFFHTKILDAEIERIKPHEAEITFSSLPKDNPNLCINFDPEMHRGPCRCDDGCGACDACGQWLGTNGKK